MVFESSNGSVAKTVDKHQNYVGVASLSIFRGNFVLAKVHRGVRCSEVVSSGGAPTPAGTSVFSKHNWDMEMGYLWLNGWVIYHLMGWTFMT